MKATRRRSIKRMGPKVVPLDSVIQQGIACGIPKIDQAQVCLMRMDDTMLCAALSVLFSRRTEPIAIQIGSYWPRVQSVRFC